MSHFKRQKSCSVLGELGAGFLFPESITRRLVILCIAIAGCIRSELVENNSCNYIRQKLRRSGLRSKIKQLNVVSGNSMKILANYLLCNIIQYAIPAVEYAR